MSIIRRILIDLQHPSITDELVDELETNLETELAQFESTDLSEVELYEIVIHSCPELRWNESVTLFYNKRVYRLTIQQYS